MNYNQLVNGQKTWDKIAELQKNIEILENGYCNSIVGHDFSNSNTGKSVSFTLDGELRELVIKYIKTQLDNLKTEFENM
jgi:hypothetical protein